MNFLLSAARMTRGQIKNAFFKALAAALTFASATFPATAGAHITVNPSAAVGGSYFVGAFRVGHGCDGSPTISLRIDIPTGIAIARPQPKPGWALSIKREKLAKPISSEGGMVNQRVSSITWSGRLPADEFDQFSIMMRLPESAGPLYFPAVQTCEKGDRRWVEIPKPGAKLNSPAAMLQVTGPISAATSEHHH